MSGRKNSPPISNDTYELYGRCIEKLLQDRHDGCSTDIREYVKKEKIGTGQEQELTEVLAMTEVLFDLEAPRCNGNCTTENKTTDTASAEQIQKQNGHSDSRHRSIGKLKFDGGQATGRNRISE